MCSRSKQFFFSPSINSARHPLAASLQTSDTNVNVVLEERLGHVQQKHFVCDTFELAPSRSCKNQRRTFTSINCLFYANANALYCQLTTAPKPKEQRRKYDASVRKTTMTPSLLALVHKKASQDNTRGTLDSHKQNIQKREAVPRVLDEVQVKRPAHREQHRGRPHETRHKTVTIPVSPNNQAKIFA